MKSCLLFLVFALSGCAWHRSFAHAGGAISSAAADGCSGRCSVATPAWPGADYTLTAASLSGVIYESTAERELAACRGHDLLRTVRRDHSHMGDDGRQRGLSLSGRTRQRRRGVAGPRKTDADHRGRGWLRPADVGGAGPQRAHRRGHTVGRRTPSTLTTEPLRTYTPRDLAQIDRLNGFATVDGAAW